MSVRRPSAPSGAEPPEQPGRASPLRGSHRFESLQNPSPALRAAVLKT